MSRFLLTQAPRHLPSWLIFDVGQRMNNLRIIAGFLFFGIGLLITIGNWGGCIAASIKRKKGGSGGYSAIPGFSLISCVIAWFLIKDKIGYWSLAPAVLDIGTLCLIAWPYFILKSAIQKK
jgi:ABC-type dipeptide/oligopeptide/nickel transport system permease subunit